MGGHIDDADPLEDADLRSGKPDPIRGVHGVEEVGDECANGVIHLGDLEHTSGGGTAPRTVRFRVSSVQGIQFEGNIAQAQVGERGY